MFMFVVLVLVPLTSPTLLFFIPESADTELRATIKYGISHLSRGLWYELEHKIIPLSDGDSLVRSLVGNVDTGITAVIGAFTDYQINNMTAIVDAFSIPVFVLNQLTSTPPSPNILLTTPSIQFELRAMERVLQFYSWDKISYFVQANTSVTNLVQGKGRCWDKVVLDTTDITNTACKNFSVNVLVGNTDFQRQFIQHYTASGCRNMVITQYYSDNAMSVPVARAPTDDMVLQVNGTSSVQLGDVIMLFPKSYPVIDTGSKPGSTGSKYACLQPSCLQYKIKKEYRQTGSVLLTLDTLKLIDLLLRQRGRITPSNIKDVTFRSVTGDMTMLLDNGFSYNRINIFKSGPVSGVELLGWVDERGLQLTSTTWSASRSYPGGSRPRGDCLYSTPSGGLLVNQPPGAPLISTEVLLTRSTRVVTICLITIMSLAVIVVFVSRRKCKSRVPVSFIFPYLTALAAIILTSSLIVEDGYSSKCLLMILRDTFEFIFLTLILYFLISYESAKKITTMTLIAIIFLIKFLVTLHVSINNDSDDICSSSLFTSVSSHVTFVLLPVTILFITLKNFSDLRCIRWILLAIFITLLSEIVIHFVSSTPVPVKVAVYSSRTLITVIGYIFSGRPPSAESHDLKKGSDVEYCVSGDHHSLHCMEHDMALNEHTNCRHCDELSCDQVPLSRVGLSTSSHHPESPSFYWDGDDIQSVPSIDEDEISVSGSLEVIRDSRRIGPDADTFPNRVKLDAVSPDHPRAQSVSPGHDDVDDLSPPPPPPLLPPPVPPAVPTPEVDGDIYPPIPSETPFTIPDSWSKPLEFEGQITCYLSPGKSYQSVPLSGISEEDEEEDPSQHPLTNGDHHHKSSENTNGGESGFYSSNSNSTEPDYVNLSTVNSQSILDDIVLIKDHSEKE